MIVRKLIQRSKWAARDLSNTLGFSSLPTTDAGTRILIYHGIDLHGSTKYNTRFISKAYFEKQVAYFSKHFNLVTLDDVFQNRIVNGRLNVAITFDDGYRNNLKYALPILEKYHAPATFFITGVRAFGMDVLWPDVVDLATTKCKSPIEIEGKAYKKDHRGEFAYNGETLKQHCYKATWDYKVEVMTLFEKIGPFKDDPELLDHWEQLTVEEIRTLAASPVATIGSHGYYHNNLAEIDFKDAVDELKKSKAFLEDVIQTEVNALAFPGGSYSRELIDAAEEIGYGQQLAAEYMYEEDKTDARVLDRFGINPFISWNNQLHCMVKNSYW